MKVSFKSHLACAVSLSSLLAIPPHAVAQDHSVPAEDTSAVQNGPNAGDIIVTAQKRSENINDVAMSVQASSGEQLVRLGVTDTAQLQKIVPGFSATKSPYGTPVYSIRGVGFQDTALGASPTVSTYVDEVPLPFSIETTGATLDLQRVEVLKGPQGTLFGNNATGGAINYVANKPGDHFEGGLDASYGRFDTIDTQGYLSAPLTNTLGIRIAGRVINSGPWQKSMTRDDELGRQDILNGRLTLAWEPSSSVRVRLTASGFRDHSQTQAPQLFRIVPGNVQAPLDPAFLNYPLASSNDRAADWSSCVNNSPTQDPGGCVPLKKNNKYYNIALRLEYDLSSDTTFTSLTSYQKFRRFEPVDSDGTSFRNYESVQQGHLKTWYQEVRLSGKFDGKGNWIVGGNYQSDDTLDYFLQSYTDSTSSSIFGLPLGPTRPINDQQVKTYAGFFNAEYPVGALTLQSGARYTKQTRRFFGCGSDGGDGTWSTISQAIQNLLLRGDPFYGAAYPDPSRGPGINAGPGGCGTTGPAPAFLPGLTFDNLDQHNISWRVGLKWDLNRDTLFYGNISKGYKAGSFPTAATARSVQLIPAVQESLLAYEAGFKAALLDKALQLNGAIFYYDYKNKQIRGSILDSVFGPLSALVNVPKSHIVGFELSAAARPVKGLQINATGSYSKSKIDGNFSNYNYLGALQNFTGEPFPLAPKWQGSVDAQYDFPVNSTMTAFVGANASYQGKTNAGFGQLSELDVDSYTLLDLRAGVELDKWRLQVWGRNVTNKYYWVQVARQFGDALVRYSGMPATYGATVSYHF